MATWSLHLSYSKHNFHLWTSSSFRTENISRRSNMEIPHSASLLDGLELCTSHVRSISTKPLTRAAELCDAVPKGACFVKNFQKFRWSLQNPVKLAWKFAFFKNKILSFFKEKKCDFRAVQRSAFCRSRRELSNAYLLANVAFDTAENEPCKVCQNVLFKSNNRLRYSRDRTLHNLACKVAKI